jgi:hypothetical protein
VEGGADVERVTAGDDVASWSRTIVAQAGGP